MTAILELGCGVRPSPRATVRHDRIKHSDHVDVAHDLDLLPWPFADAQYDEVMAFDVMEHLKLDIADWLDECWRILKPGGRLYLRLPAWDNPVSWRDPTHRKVYHLETFDYWCPGRELHENYGWFYFKERDRWWQFGQARRVNPGPTGVGDIGVLLYKLAQHPTRSNG